MSARIVAAIATAVCVVLAVKLVKAKEEVSIARGAAARFEELNDSLIKSHFTMKSSLQESKQVIIGLLEAKGRILADIAAQSDVPLCRDIEDKPTSKMAGDIHRLRTFVSESSYKTLMQRIQAA